MEEKRNDAMFYGYNSSEKEQKLTPARTSPATPPTTAAPPICLPETRASSSSLLFFWDTDASPLRILFDMVK